MLVLYDAQVCAERPLFAASLKALAMLVAIGKFSKCFSVTSPFVGPYFDLPGFALGENPFNFLRPVNGLI